MSTIRRPSYSIIGGTEATAFIQCINGRQPHIHELWCLGLDRISRKVHPTARLEVPAGTVRYFVTNYLAESGRQIPIIGQLSVNNRVQFLVFSYQSWGSGLMFIPNSQYQVDSIWWESSNNSNQNRGGRFNNSNSITNVVWGASVDARPDYLPRSPVNPRAAQRCLRDDFFCHRCQERLWCQYNWRNLLFNSRVC